MGNSLPSRILLDSTELTSSKDIANAFNDFFINVGKNLSQTIPRVNNLPLSYIPNQQTNSFFLNRTSSEEISDVISKINPSKAVGPYSIPTKILIILKDLV
jgi:hypothetical protein